jgi:hypothetical protein
LTFVAAGERIAAMSGRRISLLAAVVAAGTLAGHAAAASPSYITAQQMMAAFQENGISVNGQRQTVLDVLCQGAGYKRGSFPYERFHIFSCYVTTARMKFAQYRVNVTTSRYSYVRVPG